MKITKKMMIKFRAFSLRHVDTGTAYYVMDLWVIKTAKVNGKNRVFHLCSMCVVFVQVLCRNACTPS